ncbi:hypothetical protein EYC84_004419 [Monilinia fructicola]|uniref:Protein farnesyltransferase/geranylgeranyltransferase type-1 subunit alpha n=2 Tax=Monilinia fructicola TaxID=38448 RepID=A0A5M9K348_MONFR|nr:hypothetical protein EYC84_004419 [Monilinia fructicola]
MGLYDKDPIWDDVVPIAQDDGEGALAQIAYTDEYAEAMGYLRAVMASKEYSPRVLELTEHIITLNAAHYTVWLYRATTLFALSSPLPQELEFVNEIALENQKNYQIWHHRQLLIDHLYPSISESPASLKALADSERDFMTRMFHKDGKNYHVWSYRQYLVVKLDMFNEAELKSVDELIKRDVRNNSAWSHRFFLVFSDPKYSTTWARANEFDGSIPKEIVEREIEYAKSATYRRAAESELVELSQGRFEEGGVKMENGKGEDIRSSHALDFLADVWGEKGENEKADKALELLGDKYDKIRKNYWDWRRGLLGKKVRV